MNGFFQQLNKLRCVTAFWWFACCGSFCAGFTVRFLCCGWLCVWGCFTWNVVVCLGWLLWFCGLGSCCLSGWMSGLVMFEDGWCFTWNVGWWAHNVGVVSRETGILEITIPFMVTYRCFTWNVCGDVCGAEEWGDGFWSCHFSPTGCCGGWSF